ncbi:hypothetical protein PS15m_008991 [Mucor circinelloides]
MADTKQLLVEVQKEDIVQLLFEHVPKTNYKRNSYNGVSMSMKRGWSLRKLDDEQSEASAKSRLTTSITDQIGASSGAIASSSSPSSAAASPPSSSSAVKRRRKIMPKDFKGLSHYKQTALLVDSCSLKYWLTLLPYKECSYYIESISCHFNKLALRIYGTKLIDDRLIHYVKKEASIPNNGSDSQLADYITTILSLFRHVLLNLKKITVMCEIALQDDLNYLNNPTSLNTFREDSPDTDLQPSQSSQSSQSFFFLWIILRNMLKCIKYETSGDVCPSTNYQVSQAQIDFKVVTPAATILLIATRRYHARLSVWHGPEGRIIPVIVRFISNKRVGNNLNK